MAWDWVGEALLAAIHNEQLARYGGEIGIRDPGLLASALERPRNLAAYASPDAAALAASLVAGLTRNMAFVQGNKRTAFVAGAVFMELNGFRVTMSEADVVVNILALAAGEVSEEALADWLRTNSALRDTR